MKKIEYEMLRGLIADNVGLVRSARLALRNCSGSGYSLAIGEKLRLAQEQLALAANICRDGEEGV